jgi:hypothetical protein
MKNNYYYSLIGSFLLFLSSSAAYGQAEAQNPTFPFWKLLGNQNTDTAVNFVGTTDNRALTFRTNNIRRMTVNTDGNVGIGTVLPDTRLDVHGKATISRDEITECCGNDASLVIAENTAGTGRLSSISFHNGGLAEGGLALVSDNTGLGIASRRLRLYDNQGVLMGLQITGNFFYGNSDSRSQTRDNAGLQGNAGAQSGFYETSNPSNFPTGATSWWHLIDTRHSNPGNNYAMQLSGSFFDQRLYFRKTNNNAAQAWREVLTTPQGVAPIQIHSLTLATNYTPNASSPTFDFATTVPVANYDCIMTEYSTAFDIEESNRKQRKMWIYENGDGFWHVSINVGSHSTGNPNWRNTDVKLMCIVKDLANWNGNARSVNNGY